MRPSELSFRYAKALFLSADDAQARHTFKELLFEVARSFAADPQIKHFIETPLVTPEKKEEILNHVFENLKAPAIFCDFIRLLAAKGRLGLTQEIAEAYQAKIDEMDHVERGVVRSAGVLSDKEKSEIKAAIEQYCHTSVSLDYAQDEHILGGTIAQVGSLTFDDSLLSHLNQIKEKLTRGVISQ